MWPRALVKAAENRSPLKLAPIKKWILHKEATWNTEATVRPGVLGIWQFQRKHVLPSLRVVCLSSASWSPLSLPPAPLLASGPTWLPATGPESTCPTLAPPTTTSNFPRSATTEITGHWSHCPHQGLGEAHPACLERGSGRPSMPNSSHEVTVESK